MAQIVRQFCIFQILLNALTRRASGSVSFRWHAFMSWISCFGFVLRNLQFGDRFRKTMIITSKYPCHCALRWILEPSERNKSRERQKKERIVKPSKGIGWINECGLSRVLALWVFNLFLNVSVSGRSVISGWIRFPLVKWCVRYCHCNHSLCPWERLSEPGEMNGTASNGYNRTSNLFWGKWEGVNLQVTVFEAVVAITPPRAMTSTHKYECMKALVRLK